jgi:hypothetical protein
MNVRAARNVIALASLLGTWVVAIGCEGDPPRRSAFEDGGAGGEAGEGGSVQAPPNGGAGAPDNAGGVGVLATGGVSDRGGVPAVGGASGGVPSEPTAGDGSMAGAGNLVACEGEVAFPDQYFEGTVRDAIGKPTGPILGTDLIELKSFTLPGIDGAITITGIECMFALESVNFSGNSLGTPLSALAKLPNLRKLDLSGDYISNEMLADVALLTQLTELDLHRNFLTSVEALTNLVNLETLDLSDNGDFNSTAMVLAPLAGLDKLKTLNLFGTLTSTLQPLASLTLLETLSFGVRKIDDISPLANLVNLQSLDLQSSELTDIGALTALTKLQKLNLSYNQLSDFAPLQGLTNLTELSLKGTTLSSLASLAPLTKLTKLDVSYDSLTDVTVLGTLPALQWLDLSSNTTLTSLAPLVSSSYIGAGDDITAEALDCDTFAGAFAALIAKTVSLHTSCGT